MQKVDTIRKKHPDWQIPDFTELLLKNKQHPYCIFVFVINEGKRIQEQLKQMDNYSNLVDIVVADGGSTDASLETRFLAQTQTRALLTKAGPGKLSAQMRMAFAWALDEGYQGVIVVDGNGKDDISAIPDFVRLLEQGFDHIQGSRFIKGGRAVNTPKERLIAVKIVHAPLISLAAHHRHTDTTNGFRAYSMKLLEDADIDIFRDVFDSYELHYYLAIESARHQYRLIETPVTRSYPDAGKTPTKISPIKGNAKVMGILLKSVRGKYRKPIK
jgi:hypothetical protein